MTGSARASAAAAVLAAFALRAWGAPFGLPYTYHPDEHQYVDTAVAMLAGEPNPGRYNNPPLLKYALAAADEGARLLGSAAGGTASRADFAAAASADPTFVYLAARIVVALLGAVTVAATFALGGRAFGRTAGAAAAWLLAAAFLHVRESHFAVADVPATLLVTFALLAALRLGRSGSARSYALAGALVGLATATKYSALVAAVPVLVAHLAAGRRADRRPLVAAGSAAVAFLLVMPWALIDRQAFAADLVLLAERGRTGFKGLRLSDAPGWLFYVRALAVGLGVPLLIAALAGLGRELLGRRPAGLVLASLPLALYAYLAPQLLLFERFMLLAVPPLAVLAGALLVAAARRAAATGLDRGLGAAGTAAVLTAVLAAPTAMDAARFAHLLTVDDTRTLAARWIEANVPAGTRLLVHSNGPELAGGERSVPWAERSFDVVEMGTTGLVERTIEDYRADGIDWLVLSSYSSERRLLDASADAAHRAWYQDLADRLDPVATFRPYRSDVVPPPFVFEEIYGPTRQLERYERPGPVITVYRLE